MRICPTCGRMFDVPHSAPNTYCSGSCAAQARPGIATYSRGKGGKRDDLDNQYFRSRWEANYARYLNFLMEHKSPPLIERWEYEADTFVFHKIMRGTRTYKPDFKVTLVDGRIEYHEVKGWDYPRGRTARKRMAKYYPTVHVILIDSDFFKALKRQGVPSMIPYWETG